MLSAEAFITNIDAQALSMEESEFQSNMESARALLSGLSTDTDSQSSESAGNIPKEQTESKNEFVISKKEKNPLARPKTSETKYGSRNATPKEQASITKVPSLSELENKGAAMLLEDDKTSQVFQDYPYLFADVGDLTINDVEGLLASYKQLVIKYVSLSKGLGRAASPPPSGHLQTQVKQHVQITDPEIKKELEEHKTMELNSESHRTDDVPNRVSSSDEKNVKSAFLNEAGGPISDEKNVESVFPNEAGGPIADEKKAKSQLQSEADLPRSGGNHETSQ